MRSNLIPITKIYDIYPKYTYSDDVKKFMDEIVDIDRADVYTKDEVISKLEELQKEIEEIIKKEVNEEKIMKDIIDENWDNGLRYSEKIIQLCILRVKKEIEYGIN